MSVGKPASDGQTTAQEFMLQLFRFRRSAGHEGPVRVRTPGLIASLLAFVLWPAPSFMGRAASADQAATATQSTATSELWLAPAVEVPAARQYLAQAVEAVNEDKSETAIPALIKAA